MIRISTLPLSHSVLGRLSRIDHFNGYWSGLDDHTTGLQLLGDVAEHNNDLRSLLDALKEKELSLEIIKILASNFIKNNSKDVRKNLPFRNDEKNLEIVQSGITIGELETSAPDEIEPLLNKLIDWTNTTIQPNNNTKLKGSDCNHPILAIAIFSAVFLQISPLKNNNFSFLRFLIILLLLKAGYRYAPYASLETVMDTHGLSLFESLRDLQHSLHEGRPVWNGWLECFTTIMSNQTQSLQKKIDPAAGETLEKSSDQMADMPILAIQILDIIRNEKRCTMKKLITQTRTPRSTIKLHLKDLVEHGKIKRHGAGRGVWYAMV